MKRLVGAPHEDIDCCFRFHHEIKDADMHDKHKKVKLCEDEPKRTYHEDPLINKSCERVYIGYYLLPRLERFLERKGFLPPPPGEVMKINSLLQNVINILISKELNESANVFTTDLKFETTKKFRDTLKEFVDILDKEMETMKLHN